MPAAGDCTRHRPSPRNWLDYVSQTTEGKHVLLRDYFEVAQVGGGMGSIRHAISFRSELVLGKDTETSSSGWPRLPRGDHSGRHGAQSKVHI